MVYRQTARSEKVRATSRARLLRAAQKLFSERAYDETTMQDIVREAKTSIGNAYFYFANKEDLLTCLLDEAVRATWARADEVIASVEPGAARIAVAVYANIMNLFTSDKSLARIAVTGEPGVVRHFVELHRARLAVQLAANFPGRSEKELLMTTRPSEQIAWRRAFRPGKSTSPPGSRDFLVGGTCARSICPSGRSTDCSASPCAPFANPPPTRQPGASAENVARG
jgi:AcrR family transcriptional regulator